MEKGRAIQGEEDPDLPGIQPEATEGGKTLTGTREGLLRRGGGGLGPGLTDRYRLARKEMARNQVLGEREGKDGEGSGGGGEEDSRPRRPVRRDRYRAGPKGDGYEPLPREREGKVGEDGEGSMGLGSEEGERGEEGGADEEGADKEGSGAGGGERGACDPLQESSMVLGALDWSRGARHSLEEIFQK